MTDSCDDLMWFRHDERPCSVCGTWWEHAWGTAATFVCPECMRAASEVLAARDEDERK